MRVTRPSAGSYHARSRLDSALRSPKRTWWWRWWRYEGRGERRRRCEGGGGAATAVAASLDSDMIRGKGKRTTAAHNGGTRPAEAEAARGVVRSPRRRAASPACGPPSRRAQSRSSSSRAPAGRKCQGNVLEWPRTQALALSEGEGQRARGRGAGSGVRCLKPRALSASATNCVFGGISRPSIEAPGRSMSKKCVSLKKVSPGSPTASQKPGSASAGHERT